MFDASPFNLFLALSIHLPFSEKKVISQWVTPNYDANRRLFFEKSFLGFRLNLVFFMTPLFFRSNLKLPGLNRYHNLGLWRCKRNFYRSKIWYAFGNLERLYQYGQYEHICDEICNLKRQSLVGSKRISLIFVGFKSLMIILDDNTNQKN